MPENYLDIIIKANTDAMTQGFTQAKNETQALSQTMTTLLGNVTNILHQTTSETQGLAQTMTMLLGNVTQAMETLAKEAEDAGARERSALDAQEVARKHQEEMRKIQEEVKKAREEMIRLNEAKESFLKLTEGMHHAQEGIVELAREVGALDTRLKITAHSSLELAETNEAIERTYKALGSAVPEAELKQGAATLQKFGKDVGEVLPDVAILSLKTGNSVSAMAQEIAMAESGLGRGMMQLARDLGLPQQKIMEMAGVGHVAGQSLEELTLTGEQVAKVVHKMAEESRGAVDMISPLKRAEDDLAKVQEEAAKSLGQALLPMLTRTTQILSTLIETFNAFPGPVKEVVGYTIGVGGALASAAGAAATLGVGLKGMRVLVEEVGPGFTKLAGAVGLTKETTASLTGVIGSMGPALLGIGVAAGVVELAIASYEDEQKKLARATEESSHKLQEFFTLARGNLTDEQLSKIGLSAKEAANAFDEGKKHLKELKDEIASTPPATTRYYELQREIATEEGLVKKAGERTEKIKEQNKAQEEATEILTSLKAALESGAKGHHELADEADKLAEKYKGHKNLLAQYTEALKFSNEQKKAAADEERSNLELLVAQGKATYDDLLKAGQSYVGLLKSIPGETENATKAELELQKAANELLSTTVQNAVKVSDAKLKADQESYAKGAEMVNADLQNRMHATTMASSAAVDATQRRVDLEKAAQHDTLIDEITLSQQRVRLAQDQAQQRVQGVMDERSRTIQAEADKTAALQNQVNERRKAMSTEGLTEGDPKRYQQELELAALEADLEHQKQMQIASTQQADAKAARERTTIHTEMVKVEDDEDTKQQAALLQRLREQVEAKRQALAEEKAAEQGMTAQIIALYEQRKAAGKDTAGDRITVENAITSQSKSQLDAQLADIKKKEVEAQAAGRLTPELQKSFDLQRSEATKSTTEAAVDQLQKLGMTHDGVYQQMVISAEEAREKVIKALALPDDVKTGMLNMVQQWAAGLLSAQDAADGLAAGIRGMTSAAKEFNNTPLMTPQEAFGGGFIPTYHNPKFGDLSQVTEPFTQDLARALNGAAYFAP